MLYYVIDFKGSILKNMALAPTLDFQANQSTFKYHISLLLETKKLLLGVSLEVMSTKAWALVDPFIFDVI